MEAQGDNSLFAKRVFELRKDRGWSQPELGKRIGTSVAIIGRYERGEMTPSIEVARKLSEIFKVMVGCLVSDRDVNRLLRDQETVERWRTLDELPADDRSRILYVVDGFIRDAKARRAYSAAG